MTAQLAAECFMWSWEDYRHEQFTPIVRIVCVCGVAVHPVALLSSSIGEEDSSYHIAAARRLFMHKHSCAPEELNYLIDIAAGADALFRNTRDELQALITVIFVDVGNKVVLVVLLDV